MTQNIKCIWKTVSPHFSCKMLFLSSCFHFIISHFIFKSARLKIEVWLRYWIKCSISWSSTKKRIKMGFRKFLTFIIIICRINLQKSVKTYNDIDDYLSIFCLYLETSKFTLVLIYQFRIMSTVFFWKMLQIVR